jgi:HEAT repeat protein
MNFNFYLRGARSEMRFRKSKAYDLFRISLVVLVLLFSAFPPALAAREEWFSGLDLEQPLRNATLVMAARVEDVDEIKISSGGKGETTLLQFKFTPVRVLKGVFSRDSLTLNSADLGIWNFPEGQRIERGQLRLLILGRTSAGYAVTQPYSSLDQTIPPLVDPDDPLLATVKTLLDVSAGTDRAKSVSLILDALRGRKGAATIPLLTALQRRSLLAAQTPGAIEALTPLLADASPAVRAQTAHSIRALLDADYLDQPALHEKAVAALAAALDRRDANYAARLAAFEALGGAGQQAVQNERAKAQIEEAAPATFAEQAAKIHAVGELRIGTQQREILELLRQMPLDGAPAVQRAAEWSLFRFDPASGSFELLARIHNKFDAGLGIANEIAVLGETPPAEAAPVLLEISKLTLDEAERNALAEACFRVADSCAATEADCHRAAGELVPPLSAMLDHGDSDTWHEAAEALIKIDTDDAARALQPHLREERDLQEKLKMAEFLGRHGIRDGYPYAIEHMAEPELLEQAIAALAAIRDPRALPDLRKILETSNDLEWNTAAVRALGRLDAKEFAAQLLQKARDAKNPLAPSALIALGDMRDPRALDLVRAALASRNEEMLAAGARAAGNLAALPDAKADGIRDQLASLLAEPGAPQEARAAALDSLLALNDSRLDGALAQAAHDAGLEGSDLLYKIEKSLRDRKIRLTHF